MSLDLAASNSPGSGTAGSGTAGSGKHREAQADVPLRSFRPDIEALRAIAVLAVVLYHAGVGWLPGGFVGVDVFFVVSGYLITTHLYNEYSRTGRVRLGRFYARRARRLLPAASLVALVAVLGAWFIESGLAAAEAGRDALWAAVFAMNYRLAFSGVDYQANQEPSLLQHYWSLSVEEQFYLVWPLLMMLTAMGGAKLFGKQHRRRVVGLVIAAIVVASLWYSQWLLESTPTYSYFVTPSRVWQLGVGAFVAIAAPWLSRRRFFAGSFWATTGIVMILASVLLYSETTPFPGLDALLPTMGTALVVVAGLSRSSWVERSIFSLGPFQILGKLSYGWYLWHWPLLQLYPKFVERTTTVPENLAVAGVALILAMWTYIAFEDPLRSLPGLARSTGRSLAFGVAVIGSVVAVAAVAITVGPAAYETGEFATEVSSSGVTKAVQDSAGLQVVPGNLDPAIADAMKDKPDLGAKDGISCMVGLMQPDLSEEPGGSCVAGGTEGGSKTVLLVGDSHAYHWMPAMREVAIKNDWKLVSLTKSGCTINEVDLVNTQLKRDYTECYDWRESAWQWIDDNKPDMIVTSAAIFSPREGDFTDRWVAGVEQTTKRMVATGVPVVTIADTPYPKQDIPSCLAENVRKVQDCTLSPEEAYSDPERRRRSEAAAVDAGSQIIDPRSWFCSETECSVIVGNVPLYSDNSHMTATYSRTLATVLGDELPSLKGTEAQ